MLLHDPAPRLRDRIVAHLSAQSPISVNTLQRKLNEQRKRYSRQALYKELSILLKAGIVIRTERQYRLSLAWIFEAISYTDSLQELARMGQFGEDLLPKPNCTRKFQLREHPQVDRLWGQLTATLFSKIEHPTVYQALPHRWWPLLHNHLGRQFRVAMKKNSATSICIIKGDTYLDRLFKSMFPKRPSVCAIAPEFFKGVPWSNFTVIGEYIITTSYPDSFLAELDAYFRKIKSKREIDYAAVQHIFRNPGKITVRIEHRAKKAEQLRKKFRRYIEGLD